MCGLALSKESVWCIFCNYQQNQAFSTGYLFLVLFGLSSLNENSTLICPETWKTMIDILWKKCVHVCGLFCYWLDITDVLKTLTSELVSSFIKVSASFNWIRGFCTFSTELFCVVAKVPHTFNARTEIQLFNGYLSVWAICVDITKLLTELLVGRH